MRFEKIPSSQAASLGEYWLSHPSATFCHHPGWLRILSEAYGKDVEAYRVVDAASVCRGAAALVFFRGPVSGKVAVALPFLDYGGPLADDEAALEVLVEGLKRTASERGCGLELRCRQTLGVLAAQKNSKASLILDLKERNREAWWKALDAKVRNQVRKAEKSGITVTLGREEALEDFYRIFCENMRDLGSPVHGLEFFRSVLRHIPEAEIALAWREGRCVGGLLRLIWRDTLAIPWASTLRSERAFSPNNALYDHAIAFGFSKGLASIDFGRSTLGEGTHKFKLQWLAKEMPLPWYQFASDGTLPAEVKHVKSAKWEMVVGLWSRLPLPLANWLGPRLRKDIPA